MIRGSIVALMLAACAMSQAAPRVSSAQAPPIRFAFTSDAHYGLTRSAFRGHTDVNAHVVNAALVDAINHVGPLDFIVEGGDLANREEETEQGAIQSAAVSWTQFHADYIDGLTVTNAAGRQAPLYIVPGNHEVSNAIGFYKPMRPLVDKTALVEIYNRMMTPARPKTTATYDYAKDRVSETLHQPERHARPQRHRSVREPAHRAPGRRHDHRGAHADGAARIRAFPHAPSATHLGRGENRRAGQSNARPPSQ